MDERGGSGPERRRDRRIAADVPVVIEWAGVRHEARLKDISRGGAAVVISVPPPLVDTPVVLEMGGSDSAFRMALPGVLVATRRTEDQPEAKYSLHLRFDDLHLRELRPLA